MRTLREIANWVDWRLHGRPIETIPRPYGPWMSVFDEIRSPIQDSIGMISIVCPVYDTPPTELSECIASIESQTYRDHELVLVDDGSTNNGTLRILSDAAGRPGVRVVRCAANEGISPATNRGIEAACGEYVAFVDHDDVLRPDALEWIASALTEADVVYSDEDQLTQNGDRTYPFMKPAWSPRLLLGMNYVNHLTAIRRCSVLDAGGLDSEYGGAQDHDLLLRLSERDLRFAHLPKVLYHWRQTARSVAGDIDAKPWALDSARRTVQASLVRRGIDATAVDAVGGGPYRFALRFRSSPGTVELAIGDTAAAVNRSVAASTADIVVLASTGTVVSPRDVMQLAGWLGDPDVVAVGPKIVVGDGTVREAGWIVSGGEARAYAHGVVDGPFPFLEVARESSAVGGELLAIRRNQFLAAGGLDESLPLALAGVVLSERAGRTRGGVSMSEPAVRITVSGSDDWSPRLPMPIHRDGDPFASPHKPTDGVTIDAPPPQSERLQRLLPRYGAASTTGEHRP